MLKDFRALDSGEIIRFVALLEGHWYVLDTFLRRLDNESLDIIKYSKVIGSYHNIPDSIHEYEELSKGKVSLLSGLKLKEKILYSDLEDVKNIINIDRTSIFIKHNKVSNYTNKIIGKMAELGYDSVEYKLKGCVGKDYTEELVVDCSLISITVDSVAYDDIELYGLDYGIGVKKQRTVFRSGEANKNKDDYFIYIN